MSESMTVQVAQRGVVTLPKSLREAYRLEAGDTLTLIDLGGVFVLSPRRAEVARLFQTPHRSGFAHATSV